MRTLPSASAVSALHVLVSVTILVALVEDAGAFTPVHVIKSLRGLQHSPTPHAKKSTYLKSYLDSLNNVGDREEQSSISLPASSSSSTTSSNGSRRKIIAGNWKLNPSTRSEALDLLNGLASRITAKGLDSPTVVVFPPLPFLSDALSILSGTGIQVGAQTCGSRVKGAFTGEIAPSMLATSGVSHVLLGHSERRTIFGESDEDVNASLRACLEQDGLTVILCVGETLVEYEAGLLKQVVDAQIRGALEDVPEAALLVGRVVIAYEPVWAIGTGLVATPDQAQAAHVAIRETLSSAYSKAVATATQIQYGGSVTADSISSLVEMPDVDGALVGGASLVADSFAAIFFWIKSIIGLYAFHKLWSSFCWDGRTLLSIRKENVK